MEGQPDAQERRFNDKLMSFARRILDNDLFAAAVVYRDSIDGLDDTWDHFGGEPALMPKDNKLIVGIQLGYLQEDKEFRSRAKKYIYTDFFIIDTVIGQNELSEELLFVVKDMDPEQAQVLIEEAWQLWLAQLHTMLGVAQEAFTDSDITVTETSRDSGSVASGGNLIKLYIDRGTGEVAPRYNIPPGQAMEISLPPIGTPFRGN